MLSRHFYLLNVIHEYLFICFAAVYPTSVLQYISLFLVTCIYQFAINTLYNSSYQVHEYRYIDILFECAYSYIKI